MSSMYPEKFFASDEFTVATVSTCSDRSSEFSTQECGLKKVRFSGDVAEIHDVPHLHDMHEEDIQKIWYQKEEYILMKHEVIPVVRRIMEGERISESNKETIRGLEYRSKEDAIRRQANKKLSYATVLNEQMKQQALRRRSVEQIAAAYSTLCEEPCRLARQLALQDEEFVMKDLTKIRHKYAEVSSNQSKSRGPLSLKGFLKNLPRARKSFSRTGSVPALTVGC